MRARPGSARLAADVLDVPTVLIARTDADSARLLMSDADPRDREFIVNGENHARPHSLLLQLTVNVDHGEFQKVGCSTLQGSICSLALPHARSDRANTLRGRHGRLAKAGKARVARAGPERQ